MSQLQVVHTKMCWIAQPIHMLHHAACQQNTIQNNNAIGCAGGGGHGGNAGAVGPPPPGSAILSATPRTINQLWDEFMVGISDQKPAHLFTKEERGACEHLGSHLIACLGWSHCPSCM